MPTTLIGLVLFLALVTPGLVFFAARDRRIPQRDLSPFRETGTVLLVSMACAIATALLFALARLLFPSLTPDVGAFARSPQTYVRLHFTEVWWWGLGLLGVSSLLGFVVGQVGTIKLGKMKIALPAGPIQFESAWYKLFGTVTDAEIYCGCSLDDGSWVGGYLSSYSTEARETGDRDLVLVAPIVVKTPDGEEEKRDISAVVISAKRLRRLEVAYVPVGSADAGRG